MQSSSFTVKCDCNVAPVFVSPPQLFGTALPSQRLKTRPKVSRRRARVHRNVLTIRASGKTWQSQSSSALNQEQTPSSYIDLRTMKVIPSDDAHICPGPTSGVVFGVFNNLEPFEDALHSSQLRELLFTEDTIPLSDTQKQVVQALLSRQSVLYMSAAGEENDAIFIDIVMRNRLWKESVVYCAASRRSAEAMYAVLCAQLGPERRAELVLDLGDGSLVSSEEDQTAKDCARVIITSPQVLKRNLVTCDLGGWVTKASIVFIDNLNLSSADDWEEILLGMPSRILLCAFTKEITVAERELLPLWLESIHNSVVAISPPGAASLHDRIERPQSFPLLRTFAFNAALHDSPVQVSLTLLKDMLQKEQDSTSGDFAAKYEECFLQGITMIPAESAGDLKFGSVDEAEYADIACLVVADAKRTEAQVRERNKKRARSTKRKERTASSRAAARRRREAAYSDSLLLPAIALARGRKETEHAAFAIRSALGEDAGLLWDEDSKEHIEDLVQAYEAEHTGQLSDVDLDVLQALLCGIGIVHDGCVPAIRLIVEELYRGGLIPILVADTHLGSRELLALPCAKSILVESSTLAICDDSNKGLIKASTAAALAGRMGKDDVGNLIVMWYDEAVDDEVAGSEIASTLLHPLFTSPVAFGTGGRALSYPRSDKFSRTHLEHLSTAKSTSPSTLYTSYDGILRSLRRFGVDGYEFILDYTLDSYKGWLERAALHATLEKMNIEKRAVDERIEGEDWSSIADHLRRAAKKNEADRVFKAMQQKYTSVATQRLREELKRTRPGRIIGIDVSKGNAALLPWEQKLFEPDRTSMGEEKSTKSHLMTDPSQGQEEEAHTVGRRERLSAAVFVAVRDQEVDGIRIKSLDHRWLVICILADGMWTIVPMTDVVALSQDEDDVVPNVDLLMIPHPATFDIDPTTEWAKCCPIDDTEKAAVHRISDELIARVASENRPLLDRYQIPEFEAQRKRTEQVQELYEQSPWYGRDDEVVELRRVRRRTAELGDDIMLIQKKENELEERLFHKRNYQMSNQSSVLAVLEDCHALSILGDHAIELTPIGVFGSILPGRYPLFTAACLSLIDDVDMLSPSEFAAFVAVITCSGRIWSASNNSNGEGLEKESDGGKAEEEEEELDLSMIRQSAGIYGLGDEDSPDDKIPLAMQGLIDILPPQIAATIHEIMTALQQLHRRHQAEREVGGTADTTEIVPKLLNLRLARAVTIFSSGASWREVTDELNQESGYAVSQFRDTKWVLEMIATDHEAGEFSETTRDLAMAAYKTLDRWPVRDRETISALLESGVVEKHWSGNTYDKWWRGVRDRIAEVNGAASKQDNGEVRSVEAEILE